MGVTAFTLHPFRAHRADAAVRIEGTAERQGSILHLTYRIAESAGDPEAAVLWPQAEGPAQRRDGLWQHTCLEFFLAHPEEERYWEFNLAPNGHWNSYQLSGYRRDLQPDPDYADLPFRVNWNNGQFVLELSCALPIPLARRQPLQLAITAVVEHQDTTISYWAIHHGGTEADFHRRDGFRLVI